MDGAPRRENIRLSQYFSDSDRMGLLNLLCLNLKRWMFDRQNAAMLDCVHTQIFYFKYGCHTLIIVRSICMLWYAFT